MMSIQIPAIENASMVSFGTLLLKWILDIFGDEIIEKLMHISFFLFSST